MARKVFTSFHYKPDNWRVSTVRNIGAIEGNKLAHDNDWETITSKGDHAIKNWIGEQMHGKSCVIVLVGANTAKRKWIDYEIEKAWEDDKGILGIHIHRLKDKDGNQSSKGANPFHHFTVGKEKKRLSEYLFTYDPPYSASQDAYKYIKDNIESWIEKALERV